MANSNNNNIFKDTDIRKLKIHHTPVGIATAIFLITPSTDYDDDGQYFVRLKYKTGSKECAALVKLIDEARQEAFDEAMKLLETPKEKKNLKLADPSYKIEEDDDGNETGYTVFNFKRKAIRKLKNGDIKPVKIPLYDSVLQPIADPSELELWGGSELSIAFRLMPFYTERLGVGVSHRIEAVQILKAVTGGEQRSGEDFGFAAQSGGFTGKGSTDADDSADEAADEPADKPTKNSRPEAEDNGDY